MSESIYGKGIQIAAGFDLGAKAPLDSRTVVNTFDELQDHIEGNRVYEGMTVYVIEDKKHYYFDGEQWKVGGGSYYKGDVEPDDKGTLWVDTSVPSNLDETDPNTRLRLKFVKMLSNVREKIVELQEKLDLVESRIDEISSDNVNKATSFRARLADLRSSLTILKTNLESTYNSLIGDGDLTLLKGASKSLRKGVKDLFYSFIDLDDEVIKLLENENNMIVQPEPDKPEDGGDEDDEPTVVDGSAMLTEDGLMLMTEDGFVLLLDGVIINNGNTDEVSEGALLTELGQILLTESGQQILKN